MNEAVWIGDGKECTVYANPKFCMLLGYELPEIIGKPSYDFWDDESAQRVRQVNMTDRSRGISSSYEGNLLTKDGRKIPVLLSGTPLSDGGTIGIMTDLSELKKKEERERVLAQAIQFANDAILTLDEAGTIQSWNRGAEVTFGYGAEDVTGKNISMLFGAENAADLFALSESGPKIQLQGKHKNGQTMQIATTVTRISGKSHGHGDLSWLLIGRDVTAQIKFEEELSLKYQKLREAYNRFGITRRQMDYIFDILDLCVKKHSRKQLADFVVNAVIMLTRVDACVLRVKNNEKDTLDLIASFGLSKDWKGKAMIKYKGSLAQHALEKGMPLKIIDLTLEPRYHSPQLAKKHNLLSVLVIPLVCQGELIGSLSLYVSPERKLELFENDFIEQYASLVGLALARSGVA